MHQGITNTIPMVFCVSKHLSLSSYGYVYMDGQYGKLFLKGYSLDLYMPVKLTSTKCTVKYLCFLFLFVERVLPVPKQLTTGIQK